MFNIDDIAVVRGGGSNYEARVDDRDTSSATATLKRGEPVKRNNANFALLVATGDPEIATDILLGIATSESTETASAEGTVNVLQIVPGTVLRGKATTSTNMNTAALLNGLRFDYVTFDVTSSNVTIDEDEGDDPNSQGLCILDGDIVDGTLEVAVHVNVTLSGSLVGQTID